MSVFAPSCELTELHPTKRVRYSLGMIVGDDEMRQDQRYLMARDERHQRALHGWGVASGLELAFGPDGHLEVRPGSAVDGTGRWICIDVTQCADLLAWLVEQREALPALPATVSVWVTVCYNECATDLLPVPSGPCRSLDDSVQPTRIRDAFRLELSLEQPPLRGDLDEFPEAAVMPVLLDEDSDVGTKRSVLSAFVTSRGDPGGFANRCLDPIDPGCVILGSVDVRLDAAGDSVTFESPPDETWISIDGRPLVLSTQFLQEWLLRVEGGGTVIVEPSDPVAVPFPLDDLTDVNAQTARAGNVVVGTVGPGDVGTGLGTDAPPPNARWEERRLQLDLLADVEIPASFGASPSDAGLVLKFDGSVWRPQTDLVGGTGPAPDPEPHVRSRPQDYAIVAGGVVELGFSREGILEGLAQRTRYGELEVSIRGVAPVGALLMLQFRGYTDAFGAYPELQGRQFVVKLTPEAGGGLLRTQVVHLIDEGIVVFVGSGPERADNAEYQELVQREFGDEWTRDAALHIEISAFDDRSVDNDVLQRVSTLLEDL